MRRVYLDYNATAPIRPEARDATVCALDIGGNASSIHAAGRLARSAVERARGQVAALVGGSPGSLTFTSGGTEANALAIHSAITAGARRPIVLATEHDSSMVTATSSGLWVEAWPVSRQGLADLDWLRDRLSGWRREDGPPLAALSLANNETGVIQPVAEAAALIHDAAGWLHVDAVQAAGKIAVDMDALGADTLSLSGHKLGAPQGVGALLAGPRAKLQRRHHGGGQERGLRAGTENVSGIAGFGAAADVASRELSSSPVFVSLGLDPRVQGAAGTTVTGNPQGGGALDPRVKPEEDGGGSAQAQRAWRNAAAERLKAAGCVVAGEGAPRLPTTLCIVSDGFDSQLQVMALDLAGVMVSAGAACSSGKVTASLVLLAMGWAAEAGFALRASGGWATTAADWDRFADAWLEAHTRHAARRRVKEFA